MNLRDLKKSGIPHIMLKNYRELDEMLSRPSPEVVKAISKLKGDIIIRTNWRISCIIKSK